MPGVDPGVTELKHPNGMTLAMGGTREGNRAAQVSAWAKVMEFLRSDIRLPHSTLE